MAPPQAQSGRASSPVLVTTIVRRDPRDRESFLVRLPNVPTWWGNLTPFAWIALAARAARPVPPDAVRSGRAPTRAPAVRGKRGACGSASPTAARTSSSEKAAVPGEQARGERADRAREQRGDRALDT